jgi:phosphohistidine phosphatase SixA
MYLGADIRKEDAVADQILCIARHAESTVRLVNGALKDMELTRRGEREARRLGAELAGRFGQLRIRVVTSNAKRSRDTAAILSRELNSGPVFQARFLNQTVRPFIKAMYRRLTCSPLAWNGAHVWVTHFAFMEAASDSAVRDFRFRRVNGARDASFPYGSLIILDCVAGTVEFALND